MQITRSISTLVSHLQWFQVHSLYLTAGLNGFEADTSHYRMFHIKTAQIKTEMFVH